MKINTKEKGITLIALIVTIIVLLILAGVTIISLTGENGILGKSSDAKLKREIAKEIEQIKLSVNAVYTSYYDKGYLPVTPLRKELQTSYEGVTSVEETSDIGEATKVSKAKKKVDLGSMFGIESLAAENEDVEPTQEFAKVTYTSKREYYVKIKDVTAGNSDPVGTIYSKGGTADDDNASGNSITYNLNGGTNPEDAPTSYKKGEVIGFSTPTKDGSAFEGWYQTSDFSDEKVLRTNDTMSGSITLYAKWAEETDPSYFDWSTTATQATINGFSNLGNEKYNSGELTKLVFPKKYQNLDVTAINNSAFWEKDKLVGIIMPSTVTDVGYNVFKNCTGIEEITVPISLSLTKGSNASEAAFAGCTNIKKINFTKGTGIGADYGGYYDRTPWYISKENDLEITMEEGITRIGHYMFANVTGLKKLELPTTITSIGSDAFNNCSNWETKIDMSKWTTIGSAAFSNCSKITGEFKLSDELSELSSGTFNNCTNLTGEVKIPNKITKIESSTFSNCKGINKVIIPDTVTYMDSMAFGDCTGIEELTVPISLSLNKGYNASEAAFARCTNIKKINFTKGTGIGADYGGNYDRTPWYISKENDLEITMEEGITRIGHYMFANVTGLKKLELPTTITSIGSDAFNNCSNWETKIDMSKWTTIGSAAFSNCSKITGEFKLSDELSELSSGTFNNCTNLTGEVKIPNKITKIESSTFSNCKGINKVIIPDTVTYMDSMAFGDCTGIEELTVPISLSLNKGYNASEAAFARCTNIKKINFTKGTGIGADYGGNYDRTPWYISKENDLEITMEEGITRIGYYMFSNITGLKKIDLPSTLATIRSYAFYGISATINYNGTEEMWNSIDIDSDNPSLTNINFKNN